MAKSKPDRVAKKPAKADDRDQPKAADGGWRETVESIAMAVILALLFRGFVAEAFVIPTGSMAPTLQGRHKDVWCPKCGLEYQTTASSERTQTGSPTGSHVTTTTCPVCRYTQRLDLFNKPNDHSFSGDRIIVGKFCYDLAEPERWDVIVFKFPGDAVQNYIKRLVGLPNETVRIVGGNIYTKKPDAAGFTIARKPPHKLNVLLQLVDDTNHIPQELIDLGWPSRWQESLAAAATEKPAWQPEEGGRSFVCQGGHEHDAWLRYRHLAPSHGDWVSIEQQQQLPADVLSRQGQLIADFYAYNAFHGVSDVLNPKEVLARLDNDEDGKISKREVLEPFHEHFDSIDADGDGFVTEAELTEARTRLSEIDEPSSYLTPDRNDPRFYDPDLPGPGEAPSPESLGQHWVDDLAVECVADVAGSQGELLLMLVRGGFQYHCRINLADGKATLSIVGPDGEPLDFDGPDDKPAPSPSALTRVKGPGSYRIRLSNCDHELLLSVNGSVVKFDGPTTYLSDELLVPFYSAAEPGDLAPAGIGSRGAAVKLSGLRIYRDKYYIAATNSSTDFLSPPYPDQVAKIFADPSLWEARGLFAPSNRRYLEFPLGPNQFLPLGDNSPQSFDGRFWAFDGVEHHYVERDLLIGKALLIYWPHTWNRPIPFTPNFRKMGPIR